MTRARALTFTATVAAIGMMALPTTGLGQRYGYRGDYAGPSYYHSRDYGYLQTAPAIDASRSYAIEPQAYGFVGEEPYTPLYAYGYASGLRSSYGCLWFDHHCPW